MSDVMKLLRNVLRGAENGDQGGAGGGDGSAAANAAVAQGANQNAANASGQDAGKTGKASSAKAAKTDTSTTNQNANQGENNDPLVVSWPDRWREAAALGNDGKVDEKILKQFERYASPNAALTALIAAQNRIRSGELKSTKPFPEKGSDEEKNAWRTENGIPASHKEYQIKLAEGLAMGDEDKPVIDRFLQAAHANHMPPALANAAVNWYFEDQVKQAEELNQRDEQFRVESEDKLRAEWGNDFRSNINSITALLDMAPNGIKEQILGGRLADGNPIASNPDVLRWLAGLSRELNPASTLVPGAGANIVTAIDDEIKKIEGYMAAPKGSADWKKYWKDESVQQRYRDLLDGRSKRKAA